MKTKWMLGGLLALSLAVLFSGCEGGGDDGTFVVVGDFTVSARTEGVYYRPASPGTYRFTITGGTYSLGDGRWATALYFYRDRPVQTEINQGRQHPSNADGSVGDFQPQTDRVLAEQIGLGKDTAFSINEYAVFIVPDDLGTFRDNSGSITFLVERRE